MKNRKTMHGYVLEHRQRGRRVKRYLFTNYQTALVVFGQSQKTLVLNDEDWPRLEALLATSKSHSLHKAKLTVQW